MNIALYNLHFAAMGGGERRTAALASHLSGRHDVTLYVHDMISAEAISRVFGIDMSSVDIRPLVGLDHFETIASAAPDLFINNCYGSDLRCPAPLGIYMCMFPIDQPFDLSSYAVVTANSPFTAAWVAKRWGYAAEVVYSACANMGPPGQKRKTILNVGRIFADTPENHHKNQRVLIEAFRDLSRQLTDAWELHIVGNVGPSEADRTFAAQLSRDSDDAAVKVFFNLPLDDLRDKYREAAIYWHATGYGSDPEAAPERQEHFGMTIVEAMSSGAVPIAFRGGGPAHIIEQGVDGFLWDTPCDLVKTTRVLISNEQTLHDLATAAVQTSRRFGGDHYLRRMDEIINRLALTEASVVE